MINGNLILIFFNFNYTFYLSYEEFHPFLFKKHELLSSYLEYDSFDKVNTYEHFKVCE